MKNGVKNIQAAAYNGACMVNDLYPISSTIWWRIYAHPNLVQDKTNTQNSDFDWILDEIELNGSAIF